MPSPPAAGLVLAAGHSERLGSPKALVEVGDITLVVWACKHLLEAGCSPVAVVTNAQLLPLLHGLPPEVTTVVNPSPEKGRTGSLQVGLRHLRSQEAVVSRAVMAPVDRPGWRPDLVETLLETTCSACPSANGRRGHPVLLDAEALEAVLSAPSDAPLRALVDFKPVEVHAPWLGLNIDTPAQLEELRTNENALLAYFFRGEGI